MYQSASRYRRLNIIGGEGTEVAWLRASQSPGVNTRLTFAEHHIGGANSASIVLYVEAEVSPDFGIIANMEFGNRWCLRGQGVRFDCLRACRNKYSIWALTLRRSSAAHFSTAA